LKGVYGRLSVDRQGDRSFIDMIRAYFYFIIEN